MALVITAPAYADSPLYRLRYIFFFLAISLLCGGVLLISFSASIWQYNPYYGIINGIILIIVGTSLIIRITMIIRMVNFESSQASLLGNNASNQQYGNYVYQAPQGTPPNFNQFNSSQYPQVSPQYAPVQNYPNYNQSQIYYPVPGQNSVQPGEPRS